MSNPIKDTSTWNMTTLGSKINEEIQELCQEYWEAGFNMGKQMNNKLSTKEAEA